MWDSHLLSVELYKHESARGECFYFPGCTRGGYTDHPVKFMGSERSLIDVTMIPEH